MDTDVSHEVEKRLARLEEKVGITDEETPEPSEESSETEETEE
jgi:hypothetical protein